MPVKNVDCNLALYLFLPEGAGGTALKPPPVYCGATMTDRAQAAAPSLLLMPAFAVELVMVHLQWQRSGASPVYHSGTHESHGRGA